MNTEIINVNPAVTEDAVTALVRVKQSRTLANLAQLNVSEVTELARNDYLAAHQQGVIKFLRLFFSTNGQEGKWDCTRDGLRMLAFLDNSGALVVRVNDNVVCDDTVAGQERFIAGRWLHAIVSLYKQSELERARLDRLTAQKRDETAIRELLADV